MADQNDQLAQQAQQISQAIRTRIDRYVDELVELRKKESARLALESQSTALKSDGDPAGQVPVDPEGKMSQKNDPRVFAAALGRAISARLTKSEAPKAPAKPAEPPADKCGGCGRSMNPVERMLAGDHGTCYKCVKAGHRKLLGKQEDMIDGAHAADPKKRIKDTGAGEIKKNPLKKEGGWGEMEMGEESIEKAGFTAKPAGVPGAPKAPKAPGASMPKSEEKMGSDIVTGHAYVDGGKFGPGSCKHCNDSKEDHADQGSKSKKPAASMEKSEDWKCRTCAHEGKGDAPSKCPKCMSEGDKKDHGPQAKPADGKYPGPMDHTKKSEAPMAKALNWKAKGEAHSAKKDGHEYHIGPGGIGDRGEKHLQLLHRHKADPQHVNSGWKTLTTHADPEQLKARAEAHHAKLGKDESMEKASPMSGMHMPKDMHALAAQHSHAAAQGAAAPAPEAKPIVKPTAAFDSKLYQPTGPVESGLELDTPKAQAPKGFKSPVKAHLERLAKPKLK